VQRITYRGSKCRGGSRAKVLALGWDECGKRKRWEVIGFGL
jgi:hypothetical protein